MLLSPAQKHELGRNSVIYILRLSSTRFFFFSFFFFAIYLDYSVWVFYQSLRNEEYSFFLELQLCNTLIVTLKCLWIFLTMPFKCMNAFLSFRQKKRIKKEKDKKGSNWNKKNHTLKTSTHSYQVNNNMSHLHFFDSYYKYLSYLPIFHAQISLTLLLCRRHGSFLMTDTYDLRLSQKINPF